jgi:hypothetical protein
MTSTRDQRRYEQLMRIGCIACHIDGRYSQGDVHHIVTNGYRRLSGGNASTIILCPWHHRSVCPDDLTVTYMRAMWGPSMALESKEFARVYGSQRELLARVNSIITGNRGVGNA